MAYKGELKPQDISRIPVAIVGMACLFPGSPGLKAYWQLLMHGRDAISDVPETHWSAEAYYDADPKKPDHVYCKRGAFLPSVAFDPSEFGIPPSSLEATDTSQLLALLTARDALGDAGYGAEKVFDRERTSVVLGVTGTQEMVIPLGARLGHPIWRDAILSEGVPGTVTEKIVNRISDAYVPWQENSFPGLLGNVVAGRICNRLDLGGTNCVVDAACASSMSAVHLSLLELQAGRSDMVITGGVDTINDIFMHMCFSKTMILSKTGDIRPFSRDADGTVLGEGIGMVVLKRLEQAEKDGDRIYAVVKGMGSSSDGRSQSIYAPHAEGQVKALRKAYENAGVDAGTIELVEAHGTGTRVGDKVELNALKMLYGTDPGNRNTTALGSVKSMIGHTKAAAGSAGLIKTVLALKNKVLPPTLKAEIPDPELNVEDSPFYINSSIRPWLPRLEHPRRAAVSAFGFGGSNFHLVLEEYNAKKTAVSWDGSVEIFAFSGQDRTTVFKELARIENHRDDAFVDPTYVNRLAAKSRGGFSPEAPCRLVFVHEMTGKIKKDTKQLNQTIKKAQDILIGDSYSNDVSENKSIFFADKPTYGKLAFIFPGQGSQYLNMGRDLCCTFPEALSAMALADIAAGADKAISSSVFPCGSGDAETGKRRQANLSRTDIAQPAIGGVSLSMLDVLEQFGIRPEVTCGHSYGELSALHAAGWINRETLMELSVKRGIAMAEASASGPQGAMLAVKASASDLEPLIDPIPGVVLANMNSPEQCVLSGPLTGIESAEELLRAKGWQSLRLPVSAAFHHPMIQTAQAVFKKAVHDAELNSTQIPVFANSTGYPYKKDAGKAKDTLSQQMLQPVDFVAIIKNMYAQGVRTFVEVGPKNVLTGLVNSILEGQSFKTLAMDASCGKKYGVTDLACVLSELASLGYPVLFDHWEDPVADEKARRMTVKLNGANYKKKGRKLEDGKKDTPQRANATHYKNKPMPPYQETTSCQPVPMDNPPPEGMFSAKNRIQPMQNKMKNSQPSRIATPKGTGFTNDVLQTVSQGLKSIQALQASTAEAHQKFLETQAEAGRTLQRMMESTQRLAEAQMGLSPATSDIPREADISVLPSGDEKEVFTQRSMAPETSSTSSSSSVVTEPMPEEIAVSPPHPNEQDSRTTFPITDSADDDAGMVVAPLLEVVSELTGYPVDMLNMDMDIEADLGIDSIKRVEILSTLEERMPGLPGVEPDTMATLKTLGQIAAYLEQTDTSASPALMERSSHERGELVQQTGPVEKTTVADTLIEVVSELTGYPADMLGMDMDMEADLGIDSIKRVEILSTLEERVPGLPEVTPELMGTLKTLDQIAAYLTNSAADSIEPKDEALQSQTFLTNAPALSIAGSGSSHEAGVINSDYFTSLSRKYVNIYETPRSNGHPLTLDLTAPVYILQDNHGIAAAIVASFKARGVDAALMTRSMVDDILQQNRAMPRAAGLIITADADTASDQESDRFLKRAFMLAQAAGQKRFGSRESNTTTLLATITRLDGAFGFKGGDVANPSMGGVAGLLKTAAIEWPGTFCRALDVDPAWNDLKAIAEKVSEELLMPGSSEALEIGLSADHRCTLVLDDLTSPEEGRQKVELGEEDVVIVTGGARGVTAAAALALARHTGAKMVLMGRSEQPHPEPGWLQGLYSPAEIKMAIRENEFNNNGASPMDIEQSYTRHMANREMLSTFHQFDKIGVDMRYMPIDIRDYNDVTAAIDDIRSSLGTITAVIHGAGVIEDRLIVDKKPEQLDRVFDTKVMGLRNLLAATRPDTLKHLVIFSSVSARMGNAGQADYAMANETLNKMAVGYARQNSDCHVRSINWGPWAGGMVTPSLKKVFQNKGVGLIPIEAGARSMVKEMGSPKRMHPIEIVIGSMLPAAALPQSQDKTMVTPAVPPLPLEDQPPLNLTFKREIDTLDYPILADHVIGGKPVVPFALITEWFGHGALHDNPGLVLHGIDDMRILKGIRLGAKKKLIRLFAGRPSRKNGHYEVSVELRDGVLEGRDVIHSKGRAILTNTIPEAPEVDSVCFKLGNSYAKSVKDVYEDILFHGIKLHGIEEILACSPKGMAARISSAPSPSNWIKDHLRSGWIADPLVLDCAFQMATVWCYEETGNVSLPSYCASYRQYCTSFPTEGITALLEVTDLSDHKMTGNFLLVDKDNRLAAKMTGYEAVLDASLNKAFKPIGK